MREAMAWLGLLVVSLSHLVAKVTASAGDRSMIFQRCYRKCAHHVCLQVSDDSFAARLPAYLRWMKWNCLDECDYSCMWKTVDAFHKDGTSVQQFYGKWPFIRVFGIQEPASVVFSFLNGLCHAIMLYKLRRKVSSSAPMYYVWHLYALVAVNAWIWAVVFHARDLAFTEMLDYVFAVSLVMFSLFALCVRVIRPERWLGVGACGSAILSFYVYHVHYLASNAKFDYGYNMKVNISVGLLNAAGWLVWCYAYRARQPYVWKAAVSVVLVAGLVLLELGDFPPLWWTFDAHSLWHAGTAPVPLLWYSFVIDDCKYLLQEQQKNTDTKGSIAEKSSETKLPATHEDEQESNKSEQEPSDKKNLESAADGQETNKNLESAADGQETNKNLESAADTQETNKNLESAADTQETNKNLESAADGQETKATDANQETTKKDS